MKSLHNSAVGDFTRGGQVTIHFLRMIGQVIQKFGLAAILLYSMITVALFYFHTEPYNRYLGARWVGAWLGVQIGNGSQATDIKKANGTVVSNTIQGLADHRGLQDNANKLLDVWLHSMGQSAQCAGLVLFILFLWLYRFGRSQRQEQRLRGAQLVSAKELTRIIKERKVGGDLTFGGIPLVKDSETAHMLLTGSSGTGKTTGMYELLKQIRERDDRVVCFSPSGDFISWFFRPGKDRILNIFDGRSPAWDLWAECDQPYHYPMIAASMIPVPLQGEKIWAEAAQSLVAVLLREMHKRSTPTIAELIRIVSVLPMASIYEYVKGTEVAANLDPSNERMGASIRSTATIALRSLTYLRDVKERFTFKEWVTGQDDGSWLFLNARADQIDASRPVLSTWIEVFVSRMLSLPESRTRRIWLVIDELPTLNRLNSLGLFVEQARKFGGCAMLGFQQFSQLKLIYGPELGASIIGQCNTWICYRQNDPETAKFVADKFGKVEIEENQQGLSYGANDMRDGVSLNQQRKDREVVLPSEVMNFPNFIGLIKLAGDLPAGRFEIKRGNIKTVAEPYLAPEFDPVEELLKIPVDQLLDLSGEDPLTESERGVRLDQAAPAGEPELQPAVQPQPPSQPEQEDLFQRPREPESRRAASL